MGCSYTGITGGAIVMEKPIWPNEATDMASNKTENNTVRIPNRLRIVLLSARSAFLKPVTAFRARTARLRRATCRRNPENYFWNLTIEWQRPIGDKVVAVGLSKGCGRPGPVGGPVSFANSKRG